MRTLDCMKMPGRELASEPLCANLIWASLDAQSTIQHWTMGVGIEIASRLDILTIRTLLKECRCRANS